jgi:hypothetical protein
MLRSGVTYHDELTQVTLKVYERYAVEVVERFGFCPWARSTRESGSLSLRVLFSTNRHDFDESLELLRELQHDTNTGDIALAIYPLLDLDRLAFEDFVRRLRAAAQPSLDAFAMAAFHPHAAADLSHPDKLVPYVRRSPDPMLQLVRKSALSAIKGLSSGTAFIDVTALSALGLKALQDPAPKPVRERIAEQNLTAVREVGPATIDAVLTDIARERETGHEELAARHGQRGPRR